MEYETICTACGTDMDAVETGWVWDGGAACDLECLEAA